MTVSASTPTDLPTSEASEAPAISPWRLSVAPMLDWTDRHCRFFHRQISRHTRLYTEMVTTGALRHGDQARHLDFSTEEHPVALQIGGSEPEELAHSTRLARQWGYDEVNLNCGCPSERVQRGAFGACLMREAGLVADGVRAMRDAAVGSAHDARPMPITVKHRIGLDQDEGYGFLRDFVGTVADAGCEVFIVHARNAWLKGLSPKENREVPPLRYERVLELKRDFPQLSIVLNGGVSTNEQIREHLLHLDGVMVGREAYHNPWLMAEWDALFWADPAAEARSREAVEEAMVTYFTRQQAETGRPWPTMARHMLGLWNGTPGARRWRQIWSDHHLKDLPPAQVQQQVLALRRSRGG